MKLESPMSTSAALRALERPTVTRVWRIRNSVWSSLTNRASAVPFVVAAAEDRRADCGWLSAFSANISSESFRVELMTITQQSISQVGRQHGLFLLLLLSQCQQRKWRPTGVFTWPRAHVESREITQRNVTPTTIPTILRLLPTYHHSLGSSIIVLWRSGQSLTCTRQKRT